MNSVIRQASRFAQVVALVLLSATPQWANASDPAAPKVVAGEMRSLRGQYVTKSQSSEVFLPGGGRIYVHKATDASVLTSPQSLMLLPGKKSQTYSIILRRGLVDIDVPNGSQSRLAVMVGTPGDLRLITFYGKASINVDGRAVVAVCHEGLSTVSRGSTIAKLPPTVKRQYSKQGAFTEHSLLDATRWIGGRRVWLATAKAPVPISGYVWSPVVGATGYVVVLKDLSTRSEISRTRVESPVVEAFSKPLVPGKYELSVAAIDSDGIVSNERAQIPITVVGVELPGGAVALPKDTIEVAPEQQVRLSSHAAGLTLTTAAHKSGVAATEPFGLEGLDRATILIHPEGGGDSAALTLVKREPTVSVWVGPKLAIWPADPLQLQVSFVDAHGRPTPNDVEASVRVLLGVEPVEVTWDKQGSLWQANLPPMKDRGPWVVRVEVVDQYGNIIGRDFTEVAALRPKPRFSDIDPNALAQKHGP